MRFYWPQEAGEDEFDNLQSKSTLSPFSDTAMQFVQTLSQRLVKMRQYPEIVALGFWLRKANMKQLQHEWEGETSGHILRARGTVFHIAPSNVDTIFIYSWILSMLAGNRNIIRVSGKEHLQLNVLLLTIMEAFKLPLASEIAERTIILTYSHDDMITAKLSYYCHTRVIWGGDATVTAIRGMPLSPMANELVFPNRFSMSLLKSASVNELKTDELEKLAEQFYNDSFWFDQMACSSPRLVIWTGEEAVAEQAQQRFWNALQNVIAAKQYQFAPAVQVQKLATSLWLAADKETSNIYIETSFSRVQLEHVAETIRERHCGGGLFYEVLVPDESHISSFVNDKDQTLSYYGYTKDELMVLADHIQTRGIDRIVPIGKALDFQAVWDGQSFLRSFTREIVII